MKEIPKKNYIILACVLLITILLAFYLKNWYEMRESIYGTRNLLVQNLPELKLEEIDTFIQENPNIIIYAASSNDERNKDFERKLYDYIVKRDRIFEFVYLDKDLINESQIIELQRKYGNEEIKDVNMTYIPNFYVIQDGKIIDFYNKQGKISYEDAVSFLKEVGIE